MTDHCHFILISVGSNIDREHHTRKGVNALQKHFSEVSLSSVYESEAVGFKGAPFYNLVVGAHTDKSIVDVCSLLKSIERDHGRVPGEKKYAPRTLDLDLLTYDDVIVEGPVRLPRDEITVNAFVLQPLAELVPNESHPVTKRTYAELWANYDKNKQKLWPITFPWSERK